MSVVFAMSVTGVAGGSLGAALVLVPLVSGVPLVLGTAVVSGAALLY